jgi:hypothetical protein
MLENRCMYLLMSLRLEGQSLALAIQAGIS